MSEVDSSELFTKLKHRQGEDFFTECFAFALWEDAQLVQSFLGHLCGEDLDGIPIRGVSVSIETQKMFHSSCLEESFRLKHEELAKDSCVDMVFGLNRDKFIGVENKLGAAEGKGQLLRYLALPLTRVAFITEDHLTIADEVHDHPRYIHPVGRRHFLWSDFFQVVEASVHKPSATVLNRALLRLFKSYGFEPPIPEIGDLNDPDEATRTRNKENFQKLWELTSSQLEKRGWKKIQHDNIACLWCDDGPAARIESFYVNSLLPGSLLIRLTPRDPNELGEIEAQLQKADSPLNRFSIIIQKRQMLRVKHPDGKRTVGLSTVLEVSTAMKKPFEGAETVAAKKGRLAEYVLQVLDQAEN
ncbi:MAG: hypothetical protein WBR26_07730 [Candidatus Acidiferrum sp.]